VFSVAGLYLRGQANLSKFCTF